MRSASSTASAAVPRGHRLQRNISAGVSVGVVDILEIVDVEQDECQHRAFFLPLGAGDLKARLEGAPVQQAGQVVGFSQIGQVDDQPVALGL
ncbi:hypothetical protein G6F35_018266 [Rhizopus arrhizus]|nr:hypothetical protein G6F35_018266 [Rhizopus arrhizus]